MLATEAALLLGFAFIAGLSRTTHPRLLDAMAALLCAARPALFVMQRLGSRGGIHVALASSVPAMNLPGS